jgi:hypothetical protein
MIGLNREILWNKFDALRQYDRMMIEVYTAVKKIVDADAMAQKNYLASLKSQVDMYTKLSSDLKTKPYFRMISDSISILKDITLRKIDRQRQEFEKLAQQVFEPFTKLLNKHDDILQQIATGERNLAAIIEYRRSTDEKFSKYSRSCSEYDLLFEEELIKQQLKSSSAKVHITGNSKMNKLHEKIEEEKKAYKFQIETYNRHVPSLFNTNVRSL